MTWVQTLIAQEANRLAARILDGWGLAREEELPAARLLRRTLQYADEYELADPQVQRLQAALYQITFKLPLFAAAATSLPEG